MSIVIQCIGRSFFEKFREIEADLRRRIKGELVALREIFITAVVSFCQSKGKRLFFLSNTSVKGY